MFVPSVTEFFFVQFKWRRYQVTSFCFQCLYCLIRKAVHTVICDHWQLCGSVSFANPHVSMLRISTPSNAQSRKAGRCSIKASSLSFLKIKWECIYCLFSCSMDLLHGRLHLFPVTAQQENDDPDKPLLLRNTSKLLQAAGCCESERLIPSLFGSVTVIV